MVLRLPQRLQASQVEEVLEELKRATAGEPLEVDVSEVAKVDTAGLQLLVSLVATRHPSWVGASAPLTSAAACLGLSATLGFAGTPS